MTNQNKMTSQIFCIYLSSKISQKLLNFNHMCQTVQQNNLNHENTLSQQKQQISNVKFGQQSASRNHSDDFHHSSTNGVHSQITSVLDHITDKLQHSDSVLKLLDENQRHQQTILAGMFDKLYKKPATNKEDPIRSRVLDDRIKVRISNEHETKRSDKKYSQFYQHLDPRDKMLKFAFSINTKVLLSPDKPFFAQNQDLVVKIKEYLVEMVETVVSISFNYLFQQKLQENEAKDFASKNILLNVKSLCEQINSSIIKQIITYERVKEAKIELTSLVDSTLKEILENIAPYYPQAPPTEISSRMKEMILGIDRSGNEELDFLFTQNIELIPQQNGDYTPFIMKVVNKALEITVKTDVEDPLQHTLKEKFVNFNENLFWLAKQNKISELIRTIECQPGDNNDESLFDIPSINREDLKDKFIKMLKYPEETVSICNEIFNYNHDKHLYRFDEDRQKQIEAMRKEKQYLIGQKLYNNIKPYTNKQIQERIFYSKHSSVLRLLTKWATNLQNIFEQPQKYTMNRKYPFKTFKNELYTDYQHLKQIFFNKIKQKRPELLKVQRKLLNENTCFQSEFLTQIQNEQSFATVIKRYTAVRITATKINALLVHLMSEYVSTLIHMLVTISKEVAEVTNEQFKHLIEEINLVVFNVSDLMRSKIHCDEATFIRLLKLIYILDELSEERAVTSNEFFKLVRIKNKLDGKDNNILLNFLFMGEVQCELQIYIEKIRCKQENYETFNHFLYELTRGKFGTLSQLAIIVSQHDPIACTPKNGNYYRIKFKKEEIIPIADQITERTETFVCETCKHFKVAQNYLLFAKQKNEYFDHRTCNDCLITEIEVNEGQPIEPFFKKEHLWIHDAIQGDLLQKIKRNKGYIPEKSQHEELILTINKKTGQMKILLFMFHDKEFEWYQSWIKPQIINEDTINEQKIKYNEIFNIENNMEDEIFYKIDWCKDGALQALFGEDKYIKMGLTSQKLEQYIQLVEKKINKDHVLKSILNKSQSLELSDRKDSSIFVDDFLKNNNYRNLAHIQYLYASNINLCEVPDWIYKFSKLRVLNLQSNSIKKISIKGLPTLKELNLKDNPLIQFSMENPSQLQKLYIETTASNSLDRLNLDINSLKSLKILSLGGTSINKLALNQLPELKEVYIKNNQIQKLMIRDMKQLQILIIEHNMELFELDLANLPKLKWMKLKENPEISYLRLKNIPYIHGIDIRQSSNIISTQEQAMQYLELLLVRMKSSLEHMNFMTKIRSLKELQISELSIKHLNLTNYETLSKLVVQNNQFLQDIKLKDLQSLQELKINQNISLSGIILQNLPTLMKAELQNNSIELFTLTKIDNIKQLNLSNNCLRTFELTNHQKIKIIDLSNNPMEALDLEATSLKEIHIENLHVIEQSYLNICIPFKESSKVIERGLFQLKPKREVWLSFDDRLRNYFERLQEKHPYLLFTRIKNSQSTIKSN